MTQFDPEQLEQIESIFNEVMDERRDELEEKIESAVNNVLDKRRGVDETTHRAHHVFVQELIEEREDSKIRWKKIQDHVIGWAVVGFILTLVSALGMYIKHLINGGPPA